MKAILTVTILGVVLAASTGTIGHLLHFENGVEFNNTCGASQPKEWSAEGTVKLSPGHAFFFKPQVKVNVLQELCSIDLTKCPPEELPTSPTSCYCKSKEGDRYNIHIGSHATEEQRGLTLQAVMPAQRIFPDTYTAATIGQVPYAKQPLPGVYVNGWYSGEVREDSPFYPYYQINGGKYTQLNDSQVVSVCANKMVFLEISFHNPHHQAELTLKVGDVTIKSTGRGVEAMHKFYPSKATTAVVMFKKPNECTHVKYIYIKATACSRVS